MRCLKMTEISSSHDLHAICVLFLFTIDADKQWMIDIFSPVLNLRSRYSAVGHCTNVDTYLILFVMCSHAIDELTIIHRQAITLILTPR